MEVELLEQEGSKIKFRIVGEGHTFSNILRKKLHEFENVETAAYNIEHPLLSDPEFYVKTEEGESPKDLVVEAAESLKEDYENVEKEFQKALEQ